MGQNGRCLDHKRVVLLCYPPHSPALPDKIVETNILIISLREIEQDAYYQPWKCSFFLRIHLYDLLSTVRVGSLNDPTFEIGTPTVKGILVRYPNRTMLVSYIFIYILAEFASE